MHLFHEDNVISLGKADTADTTGEVLTAVEDMSGFDEIDFIVKFADIDAAAIITMTVKENTASSTSSPTPTTVTLDSITSNTASAAVITSGTIVATESSDNLDEKIFIITVAASVLTKRYVFLSITATVESYEIEQITTIKRRAKALPVTQSSDVFATAYAVG